MWNLIYYPHILIFTSICGVVISLVVQRLVFLVMDVFRTRQVIFLCFEGRLDHSEGLNRVLWMRICLLSLKIYSYHFRVLHIWIKGRSYGLKCRSDQLSWYGCSNQIWNMALRWAESTWQLGGCTICTKHWWR